jgi:hypothetical protein
VNGTKDLLQLGRCGLERRELAGEFVHRPDLRVPGALIFPHGILERPLARERLVECRWSRPAGLQAPAIRSSAVRWRICTASLGTIGPSSEVGYDSEAAFMRAFKREFGIPPGQFRRSVSQPHQRIASGDYPAQPPSDAA